ncbi:MAG: ATP-dependent DNA helicase RecG [Candidatus Omnitrophota bacterium]
MNSLLDTSIQYLKGVGPKRAKIFNKAGIWTVEDLLYYFPRRYEDRAKFSSVSELKEGDTQTIKVKILARGQRQSWRRRRFSILELAVGDDTGRISCVWFNQPYLKEYFKVGLTLILYGKVERYGKRLQMSSPEFEIISDDTDESLSIGRIVPVYSLLQGLSQRGLRRFIKETLDEYLPKLNDFLPFDIRSKNNLVNLAKSILEIHFPESFNSQKEAYRRLAFQEFFLFQILLALRKSRRKQKQGITHKVDKAKLVAFINSLPFKLTHSQKAVITEIISDMEKDEPMQRLLQGDVGSGKTIVALIAGLAAIGGGYQAAFMAPTEILAKQHYEKISAQLKNVRTGLICGGTNKKAREKLCQQIKNAEIDLIIGTHALLQESILFKNLGLVIIDEQHKFGVGQRALLPQKGFNPDVLIMTATPIPRTLAITLYGDLDISVINELPEGRIPIKTTHFTFKQQDKAYDIALQQLARGHQAYIIYPVIEESYALDIAGAKKMYERLKANEFKEFKVGLVHGRQKQNEQDEIMSKFKNKELDVLVSTTVLEVGIDIPEATCMIIENAERFGLSQLHQLRGRVGRGPYESFCLLLSDLKTDDVKARIAAMVKHNSGFYIAEEDLKIRGPGEFFGRRQHGLSELKIGNPLTQMQLLKKAREEALRLVSANPQLDLRPNILLKEKLLQRFPEYEKLVVVG